MVLIDLRRKNKNWLKGYRSQGKDRKIRGGDHRGTYRQIPLGTTWIVLGAHFEILMNPSVKKRGLWTGRRLNKL